MDFDFTKITLEDLLNSADNLSKVDAEINNLYHVLEYCTLDAVALVRVAKQLQSYLKTRRQLKEIRSICQQLSLSKFNPKAAVRADKYKAEAELSLATLQQTWSK